MSLNKVRYDKLFGILSFSFFTLLVVMAILYTRERILISDPAYMFFNVINNSDYFIPHGRHTAVLYQTPLLLATKMNLPLAVLLPLYSVSFVLVRALYFFLAYNVFKSKTAGFAIIAVSAIGVAESYFRPTSESNLALLNSILFYAFLSGLESWKLKSIWKVIIGICGSVLFVIFGYISHSIALFPLVFVLVFYAIEFKKYRSVIPYASLFIILAVFMSHIFIGNEDAYHDSLYQNLFTSPLTILKELDTYYPYKFFFRHFKSVFFPYGILLLFAVLVLAGKRKWFQLSFLILFSVFYFIVSCTSFKDGDSNMQMEKIFLPLTLFASVSFFAALRSYSGYRKILSVIALAIVLTGLSRINKFLPVYGNRIDTIKKEFVEKADKVGIRKLVVEQDTVLKYPMVGCWAFGIETLILSTLDKDMEPLTIFIDQKHSEIEERMNLPDNFMPALFHTSFNYGSFNKNYFALPEQKYMRWDMQLKN